MVAITQIANQGVRNSLGNATYGYIASVNVTGQGILTAGGRTSGLNLLITTVSGIILLNNRNDFSSTDYIRLEQGGIAGSFFPISIPTNDAVYIKAAVGTVTVSYWYS